MSVYPDFMVEQFASNGGIEPFDKNNVNPASYDLTMSNELVKIVPRTVADPSNYGISKTQLVKEEKIKLEKGQRYILHPGDFVLASSVEYVKLPASVCGIVMLKSTPARSGIGHMYAGYIDPGFEGNITFELYSLVPVVLTPGQPICQIVFIATTAPVSVPYGQVGRYHKQVGPTPARKQASSNMDAPVQSVTQEIETPIGMYERSGLALEFEEVMGEDSIEDLADDWFDIQTEEDMELQKFDIQTEED